MAQFDIKSDPRYTQGKLWLRESRYEDAINMFASLTSELAESYGETSLEVAPAYFAYGNALLTKEEETAEDILGQAAVEAKEAITGVMSALGGDMEEATAGTTGSGFRHSPRDASSLSMWHQ